MSLPKPYYEEDGITIWNCDCREILPYLPKCDLTLLTDPPYGVNLRSGWRGNLGECRIAGDANCEARDAVLCWAESLPCITFGSWKQPRPANCRAVLIWDKGGHSGMGDLAFPWKPNFEEIYVSGSGFVGERTTSVLQHYINPTFNATRKHPTQKPLSLMLDLARKTPAGSTLLDPFMGSGTTLVAAKQLGRRAIGIELSEDYCAIAVDRLRQDVLPLSAPEPQPEQASMFGNPEVENDSPQKSDTFMRALGWQDAIAEEAETRRPGGMR